MARVTTFVTFGITILTAMLFSRVIGWNDVTEKVFGGGDASKDILPVAFTDYNGDRRTDLVVLTTNFSSFRIYLGSSNEPTLQFHPAFQCDIVFGQNNKILPVKITGLNVADFTGDGINDILVTFKYNSDDSVFNPFPNTIFASVFKGGLNKVKCVAIVLNNTAVGHDKTRLLLQREPLIVDINGDMIADLVGETVNSGERKVWTFRQDSEAPIESKFGPSAGVYPLIVTGGFVDIDGDFAPELVLITNHKMKEAINDTTSQYFVEIYETVRTNHGEFKLQSNISIKFPVGRMGNALFLDISLTGRDHQILLPFCRDKKCQKSGFALVDVVRKEVYNLDVQFTDDLGNAWTFLHYSLKPDFLQTISVHAGDYNLDGYPDLVVTLTESKKSISEAESRSVLFKNVPCQDSTCDYSRTFEPKFNLLDSYSDVISTTFFDSNQNGLLDVMGLRRTSHTKSQNETFSIFVRQNSPEYDAYFVKWAITTGICEKHCPPYGVMLPGGTMKYSTINLDSEIQSSRASHVYRANFALDLPGNLMGIGASANFIDTITFGGLSKDVTYTRTQIIPNSNLIAIPPRDHKKGKWVMKQKLRPNGEGIMATFHVLLFICVANAAVVFFLHMRERKMDRIERHKDPLSMSALTMS